jgi:hypothetical protein
MIDRARDTLADLRESLTADPQSQDHRGSRSLFSFGERADAVEPSDDIEDFRDLYENNPIVRTSLRTFVQEVLQPGYEVEGASNDLEEWVSECAYIGAQRDQDLYLLLKQALLDREIAGSACIEHVPAEEDEDRLAALKLFRAETVRAYTKPGQNILVHPDDDFDGVSDYPRTADGDLAAFVQFDDSIGKFKEKNERRFAFDDITLITRDRRTGDVWGTSRLKAVQKRAEGFIEKLDDSDEAVKTMSHPHRVLRFGDEEHPWSDDEIDDAIDEYNLENFEPGMSTGLPFDVEVEELSGELPELRDNIKTDIDVIMSGMPIPKYELGGFEENINQFVSKSQERRQQQQIEEARRELEREFTPILQEKAEELDGVDSDDVELVIEPDEEDEQPQQSHQQEAPEDEPETPEEDPEQEDMSVWDVDLDGHEYADLADPRFVSVEEEVRELQSIIADVLVEARDEVLDRLESQSQSIADLAADPEARRLSERLSSVARRVLNRVLGRSPLQDETKSILRQVVEKTLEKLAGEDSKVQLDTSFGLKDEQAIEFYAQNVENQVKDATDEMYREIRTQVRHGLENGEGYGDIRRRIEDRFNDDEIEGRSGLIARMEVQNAVSGTRVREYEESDVVEGVRPINPCGPDTTPLCRDLAGCDGDSAEAYFDEGSLSDQWMEHAPANAIWDGFKPLPPAPPFHWNCRTGLVPIVESEREDLSTRYTEGDEVSTPDGVGVVVEVRTSNFEGPSGDEVEASDGSPAYVVAVRDGAAVFKASELETDEIEVDVESPEEDIGGSEDACAYADLQDGRFSWPESWQESEQPARMIALKAWASMGGTFRGCRSEMSGEIARPNAFCADFKDRILKWEGWRQGGDDLEEHWERQGREDDGEFKQLPGLQNVDWDSRFEDDNEISSPGPGNAHIGYSRENPDDKGRITKYLVRYEYGEDNVLQYDHQVGGINNQHDAVSEGVHYDVYIGGKEVETGYVKEEEEKLKPGTGKEALDIAVSHLRANAESFINEVEGK